MPALTWLIMYAILSGFTAAFLYGVYKRIRIYFKGAPPRNFDHIGERIYRVVINAFAQRKVMKKRYPGLMHLLIYSGIIVLAIGTTLVMIDSDFWEPLFHSQFLVGNFYLIFELALDVFGLVAIAGLLVAIIRRTFSRPPNLPTSRDDIFIFASLIVILVTGYVMEGIRLAIDKPPWAPWSFVGYRVALFLESRRTGRSRIIFNLPWPMVVPCITGIHRRSLYSIHEIVPSHHFAFECSLHPHAAERATEHSLRFEAANGVGKLRRKSRSGEHC